MQGLTLAAITAAENLILVWIVYRWTDKWTDRWTFELLCHTWLEVAVTINTK